MAGSTAARSERQAAAIPPRDEIAAYTLADETKVVRELIGLARLSDHEQPQVEDLARRLVNAARAGRRKFGGIDAFMNEYGLSTQEGVTLMCLAEALLRIPDADTADKLIADKIGGQAWDRHLGKSDSSFVNASTWGLMLTGQVVELGAGVGASLTERLGRMVSHSGEPVIRQAMRHAMRILGRQFVLGRTIEEALARAKDDAERGYRFSFDMLGEAAMTMADAERYFAAYRNALLALAKNAGPLSADEDPFARPSISVKLSALHPRYEPAKVERVHAELVPRVKELAVLAREHGLGLTIDAEEAERLDLSLQVFAAVLGDSALKGWDGLGLAVQAYSKRGLPVLRWLDQLAAAHRHKIPLRLVKGAYWDTEIKMAQEAGYDSYPLFTRKPSTDLAYLACGRFLLDNRERFYPQFATHNAHTVAAMHAMAGNLGGYEFQRLHGMGQALYDDVVPADKLALPGRIYAPVGSHEDLLAYLVRRLLENGANSSFVNRLADDEAPIREIIADPVREVAALGSIPHPMIPLPADLWGPRRRNSRGLPLWEDSVREPLVGEMRAALKEKAQAAPLVAGKAAGAAQARPVLAPHDRRIEVGSVVEADATAVERALAAGRGAAEGWDRIGGKARAAILERAADLYEENRARLMGLIVQEAGKTLDNALGDLREAVDFLRYYAAEARERFEAALELPGPTGERNQMRLHGRGLFACISPWNFPLAIFTGQLSAALAAGNAVIAKPAEQTPLVAFEAARLLHKAGVPTDVLQLLPGRGEVVGAALVADPRVDGVAFTGSNPVAAAINRALAARDGPIGTLIAETGGINAMIVDSTALPEQTIRDAVRSAFDSAGQRCSALRVLYIQEDVAPKVMEMLTGAMRELTVGDPFDYATDVGPVIDAEAKESLDAHKVRMANEAKLLCELDMPAAAEHGSFVTPAAFEIDDIAVLKKEVFGPILHVVRYSSDRLDQVCEAINATGYGLTLGIHSRIEQTVEEIVAKVRVGNIYVNRNQIGAVVGSQPFGGEGLSGTGPKAGGPNYLPRFAVERVVSTDTTASGGNAALMTMPDTGSA